jgi:hypothetical protein
LVLYAIFTSPEYDSKAKRPASIQKGLDSIVSCARAKVLSVMEVGHLTIPDGRGIDWRKELTQKLVEKQKGNGSWVNDSGRWWENDPILVTAYSLIAMNIITP